MVSIRWRKQFLKKLGKSDEKLNVIDLLSGLGENWSILKQNFSTSNFYALDFSENMISQSSKKKTKIFDDNLTLICDDLLQNQLESSHFDIISCAYGLKTFDLSQLEIMAKEISRILKPNGKFSFVEVSKPNHRLLALLYEFYLSKIIPI